MFIFSVNAQIVKQGRTSDNLFESDSTTFKKEVQIKLDGETTYTDYKIISIHNDTTVVDTTLTLKKDFIFNYIRKDNFELLPFHNQGQTFNKLGYNFENNSIFPVIGFSSKQFNYYKPEDIPFYYVPTPTSELMYRTGLEQGQMLDTYITMNTSKQLNFSFAYKGLRSLGNYRNSLSSHGNFRTTFNYRSKGTTYMARGHFSSFDLLNQENGGITPESIVFFENNDPNYSDRARLEVNFSDAENILEGKRYYLEQQITLFSKKNTIEKHNINVSNQIQKYNSVLKEIENLKKGITSSPEKDKFGELPKRPKETKELFLKKKNSIIKPDTIATDKEVKIDSLTKKIPLKKKDSITKPDSIATDNVVKIDSLTRKIPLKKKDTIIKPDLIATDNVVKIDSLTKKIPLKKKDSIIKPDSIATDKVVKIDSLTKKIPLKKKDSIIKPDSIATDKVVKIDSLTRKIPLKKKDSIIKLDSIAIHNKVKIDSLLKIAAEIKIDSTQLLPITEKSLIDVKFGHILLYETNITSINRVQPMLFSVMLSKK